METEEKNFLTDKKQVCNEVKIQKVTILSTFILKRNAFKSGTAELMPIQ